MHSTTDVKVVHSIMQSSSMDKMTEFTLLQRKKGKTLGQLSGFDKKKADMPTLEPILGCFHDLDESRGCSTYPGLLSQPDESKRAKKMLELAIHSNLFWVVFMTWMRTGGA
jgi:hypothetical protein